MCFKMPYDNCPDCQMLGIGFVTPNPHAIPDTHGGLINIVS